MKIKTSVKSKRSLAKNVVFLVLSLALLATITSVIRAIESSEVTVYINVADFIKGTDLEISPAELTLKANLGETIVEEFLVTNKGDKEVYLSIEKLNIQGVIITTEPNSATLQPLSSKIFKATMQIPETDNPIILIDDGEGDCPTDAGFGGNGEPRIAWGCNSQKPVKCDGEGETNPHNEYTPGSECPNYCCSFHSCGRSGC